MRKRSLFRVISVGIASFLFWSTGEGFAATLTVTKDGTGTGTVTSSPGGINCGSDCTESYPEGQKVTLKAKPDSSSLFGGWSGDCSGMGSCSLVIGADPNVTATFQKKEPHLSVSPGSLDFGSVKPGGKISQTLTVSNTGTGDLHVILSGLEGTDFGVTGSSSQTIKPGKSSAIKLFFKPQTEGDHTATLRISSDDQDAPLKEIQVEGHSVSLEGTDYSKLAKGLVKTLAKAKTPQARYDALLTIMGALHVGVYTSEGKAVLIGYERGPDDFYLYDFELTAMASALEKNETFALEDVADPVNAIVSNMEGDEIDTEALRQALLSGVQSAVATPKDIDSLLPLLLLEMGLSTNPSYDMRTDVSLEKLKLNALQRFLIFTSIFLPFIQDSLPIKGSAVQTESTTTIPIANDLGSLCDSIKGAKGLWKFNGWALKLGLGTLGTAGKIGQIVVLSMDAIHGMILAYSVNVTTENEALQATHYGPSGHEKNAGKELRFKVKVEMLDQLPRAAVKCGWIAQEDFPPQGPMEGITIVWDASGLEKLGSVSYDPSSKKTGSDGISTLIFKPKEEKAPGEGKITVVHGDVAAFANYLSAFGNIPGSVNEYITPKMVFMPFEVGYHGCPKSGTLVYFQTRTSSKANIKWTENGTFNFGINDNNVIDCSGDVPCETCGPCEVTSQLQYSVSTEDGNIACQGTYTWKLTGQVNGVTKDNCGNALEVNLQVTGVAATCFDSEGYEHSIDLSGQKGSILSVEIPYENGKKVNFKDFWPPSSTTLKEGYLILTLQ